MRRLALPLALIVGLLASGSVSAAGKTAFTGEWIGNDPPAPAGDGSVVHLYVTGGTHAKITFTDEYGTVCVNEGASNPFFRSTITGEVDGDNLYGTFHNAHCGNVPLPFLRHASMTLALDDQGNDDPADDTLYDGSVTWHRVS